MKTIENKLKINKEQLNLLNEIIRLMSKRFTLEERMEIYKKAERSFEAVIREE